jgi:NADH-ubiquinone oxidoreductase chain 4L
VLTLLILLEVLLLMVTVHLIHVGGALSDLSGTIFAFYIVIIAGAESAIGLSILVAYYKLRGYVSSTI